MKNLIKSIKQYCSSIDYSEVGACLKEVTFLTIVALSPLLINLTISTLTSGDFIGSLKTKVIPGEILSYSLSFLAPSLYLLTKINNSGYRLPLLHTFSLLTLLLYLLSFVLSMVAKNNWVDGLNMGNHSFDLYFKLTLIFLVVSILLRIYSLYHGRSASKYSEMRSKQQSEFNMDFTESINNQ
jgi:hypothetical protein